MAGNFFQFDEGNLPILEFQLRSIPYIFWDSGFFIRLLDNNTNSSSVRSCKALRNLLKSDSLEIISVTSDFVIEEVINHFISGSYICEMDKLKDCTGTPPYKSWTELYKEKPEIVSRVVPIIGALFDIMDEVPVFIHRPQKDIEREAHRFIEKFNLCAMDAYILAVMLDANIEDFITTDVRDMKRVKDENLINIYSFYHEPRLAV